GGTPLQTQYSTIATGKNLVGKISAASVIGMNATADALIRGWIRTVAANSQDVNKLGTAAVLLDDNGLDLGEMINKVMLGSIAYYQATSVYLNSLLDKNNAVAAVDANGGALAFTEMEHGWDEAFGYFGAARDFARYSDAQLAGTSADYSYDSNGDGKIDFRSEYNYTFARYAGRRDRSAGSDLTKEIFDAFLAGRTAIVNKASVDELIARRRDVSLAWERIIAATAVHYMNDVERSMRGLDTTSAAATVVRHQWSEMKGYVIALQFNSLKTISDARLNELHTLIGSKPVIADAASAENVDYRASITSARAIIKSVYGFTDAQMNAW
ncbi:MAG: DUF4856 domain-containing protein, partial [bacterium]|nr:DUF4856 domain-containing protein [Candidatus Kapabacteria bacterium]